MAEKFDIILVGSGFSSIFFLHKLLEKKKVANALILERGRYNSLLWQVENRKSAPDDHHFENFYQRSGNLQKHWPHTIGLGGGSNCWWANAMRIHPDDFRLKSKFGVGADWPVGYDALEPYYTEAEEIMSVSGDNDSSVIFPRSKPFPQPRHRFSRVARSFKDRFPESYFAMPQTRARLATGQRNPCCSNSLCTQCPVNAKFTIIGDLGWVFKDPRVTVRLESTVQHVIVEGGVATGVEYKTPKGTVQARSDFVVLGTNGIYNPFILLKSGIDHGPVGKGLHEQIPVGVHIHLDGMEDGDGSAHISGVGYNFASGAFREHAAGGFFETDNLSVLRGHKDKYRAKLSMTFLLDDLRQDRNFVDISPEDPDKPRVHFEDWSPYAHAGLDHVRDNIADLVSHLPIEQMRVQYGSEGGGHAHLQGTTVMGNDPETSVVDGELLHHKVRNLAVLGSGAFPTGAGANPTLTIAALALRSADRVF